MKIKAEISDEELRFEEILKAVRNKKIKQGLTVTFNQDAGGQLIYTIEGEVSNDAKSLKNLIGQEFS